MKGFLLGQLVLFSEGLNPFEIPGAPSNLSLSQFNDWMSIITLDGYEISASGKDLSVLYGKDGKSGFIIPIIIDQTIQYIKNCLFFISYILYNSSYLFLK